MDHCPKSTITAKYVQEAMEICLNGDAGKKSVAKGLRVIECSFGPTSYKLVKGTFKTATDGKSDQYDFYLRGMPRT